MGIWRKEYSSERPRRRNWQVSSRWTLLPSRHPMGRTVSSSPGVKGVHEDRVPVQTVLKIQQYKRKIYLLKCEADLAGSDACSAVSRLEKRK